MNKSFPTFVSAPTSKRQNPCFITGNTALPAEVADTVPALANVITCDTSVSRFLCVVELVYHSK